MNKRNTGFTLVEFSVVIVIVGILAAVGVPKFRDAVERSKASEAFSYLSAVRSAQERHHSRQGAYTSEMNVLGLTVTPPKYFNIGNLVADETTWALSLTRSGPSAGYGAYTVTFTEEGYDAANSTIDALTAINPMGT